MLTEPIRVTLLVTSVLENLNIPYFIGGSLATAVHGVARATMDVDLVATLETQHIKAFADQLGAAFFIDSEMISSAIQNRASFNIIHKETMFKVDIFVGRDRPFDRSQFARRTAYSLADQPDHQAYVSSPEDNILAKLEWFRLGGEVSDRQWQDILTVIKIQGKSLDVPYLNQWAEQLGVNDLLQKALQLEN
jgi:hypothetical protein